MARLPKIPPKLHGAVMNFIAEGLPAAQIREKLAQEYNIEVSDSSMDRLIRKLRTQYQASAQTKLARAAEKAAMTDLDIMENVINDLYRRYQAATDDKTATILAAELNKWNERRIKLSGIDKEDQIDNTDAKEELMEQLEFAKKEPVITIPTKDQTN